MVFEILFASLVSQTKIFVVKIQIIINTIREKHPYACISVLAPL